MVSDPLCLLAYLFRFTANNLQLSPEGYLTHGLQFRVEFEVSNIYIYVTEEDDEDDQIMLMILYCIPDMSVCL